MNSKNIILILLVLCGIQQYASEELNSDESSSSRDNSSMSEEADDQGNAMPGSLTDFQRATLLLNRLGSSPAFVSTLSEAAEKDVPEDVIKHKRALPVGGLSTVVASLLDTVTGLVSGLTKSLFGACNASGAAGSGGLLGGVLGGVVGGLTGSDSSAGGLLDGVTGGLTGSSGSGGLLGGLTGGLTGGPTGGLTDGLTGGLLNSGSSGTSSGTSSSTGSSSNSILGEGVVGNLLQGVNGLLGDAAGNGLLSGLLTTLGINIDVVLKAVAALLQAVVDLLSGLLTCLLKDISSTAAIKIEKALDLLKQVIRILLTDDATKSTTPSGTGTGGSGGGAVTPAPGSKICLSVPMDNSANFIVGDNNSILNLANILANLKLNVNILSTVSQTQQSTTGGGVVVIREVCFIQGSNGVVNQIFVDGNDISGSNSILNLLNLLPDLGLTLNQLCGNSGSSGGSGGNSTGVTTDDGQICFFITGESSGNTIIGNDNSQTNILNIIAKLGVNLNLLSTVTQTTNTGATGRKVCIPLSSINPPTTSTPPTPTTTTTTTPAPTNGGGSQICFDVPMGTPGNTVVGNNNIISNILNVVLNLGLNVNILSQVKETTNVLPSGAMSRTICIPLPPSNTTTTTPPPTTISTTTPTSGGGGDGDGEICFDLPIQTTGNAVTGNNNRITNILGVIANLGVNINLLSSVRETSTVLPTGVVVQRVCVPKPPVTSTPKPTPIIRCFKKGCKKWGPIIDYPSGTYPQYESIY